MRSSILGILDKFPLCSQANFSAMERVKIKWIGRLLDLWIIFNLAKFNCLIIIPCGEGQIYIMGICINAPSCSRADFAVGKRANEQGIGELLDIWIIFNLDNYGFLLKFLDGGER